MSTPELTPQSLPTPADTLAWIEQVCDGQIATARSQVAEFKASPPATALDTLRAWNAISTALLNAEAIASTYGETNPDAAVRTAADAAMQRAAQFSTELGLDSDLYAIFAGLSADDLDPTAQRLLQRVLRDFRRSGVDRDAATRERLRELSDAQVKAGQEFAKNIREGVRSIRVPAERLPGMPADWLAEHPADADGLITVTTDYPDLVPVRTFCSDAQTRAELTFEALNIAWPVNDEVLHRLVDLRTEQAQLLGYADWSEYDTDVKMIGSGAAIGEFIDKIAAAATPSAERDLDILLARYRADVPAAQAITRADYAYYAEVIGKERYSVDGQQVRQYFDFATVRAGLLEITGRLFGLTWEQVPVQTWHEEVTAYDVLRDGARIGRIYLDLHPREGKYKHAAQFGLRTGVRGVQLPEGVLVCNFNRGLMEHDHVVTLFHEFGHLIHHIVGGDQEWVTFSGVATEWDFVEAPSQMLEEWAWDPTVLASFATNAAGEVIPADLVAAMRQADNFGKGINNRTQMHYAALSAGLYQQQPQDITAFSTETARKYSVVAFPPDSHFHTSFGHLDGYSSGYYTYAWSEVIAKDLFSAFDRDDLLNADIAGRYRDTVLARGGSDDAAHLVRDFLGRDYTFDAYEAWLAE